MAPLTIGLLIDWLDNDYASSLSFAFFDEVRSRGMRFLCFVGHGLGEAGTPPNASNLAYQLANERVLHALVVASLGIQSSVQEQCRYLERYRALPLCTLALACPGVPHISVDNAAGMRAAVAHLIQVHARRRIAFVRGPESSDDAEQRYRGYLAALQDGGIAPDPELVLPGSFVRDSGRQAVHSLCERRVSFDALVAANDTMAAAALVELQARGLRVPQDVALCGFDDVEDSRFADPPISSVSQPWRARARLALDALLAQREGRPAQSQVVAAEFVPRRSCGCDVSFELSPPGRLLGQRVENWDWRDGAASLLMRELSLRGIELQAAPARALVECFWQEVSSRREGGFLLLLEQELADHLLERASLSAWYHALAPLRALLLERLGEDAELCARADALMHLGVERVSYATERQQALRRLAFERQGRLLALAGQATSTAFDPEGIGIALRHQLPELGVPSFFVSQYLAVAGAAALPARCRLLISHDDRRSEPVLGSRDFDSRDLVPAGFWPSEHEVGFVIEVLHFQNEPLGFALFEIGPRQGAVYMALREQLGAALEGASLVRQVARRALQREQAERARMQDELRVARRVQVSILPTRWKIAGLDVAAALRPGQLAGADYFDIRPDEEGAWLALGSARSGGLGPGLMVPMLQSIVACLCHGPSAREPERLLRSALLVLEENVERRMRERQYFSLLLARYNKTGWVRFAADYAGVALCPWHGGTGRPAVRQLGESPRGEPLFGGEFQLAPHDLLLLHTQGLTRSSDFEDAPIRDEQIALELERNRASPVAKIRDDLLNIVQNWSGKRADLSVIVGRRLGPG
jgi:sigma-B regulation protein RsbU (phosphoserine phosphatase)